MKRRVAVRGIIVVDGKLLCFKLRSKHGDDITKYWCVPGGGVDVGEPLLEALEREMIEETGVKPEIGNLLYVQQFFDKQFEHKEQMEFFFHIINGKDYLNIDLGNTSHGMAEVAEFAFIDPSKNFVLPKFLTTESFHDLGEHPTKFFSYF